MGRSIDERIVEMRFDNQQFERNVRSTMSTLDKLKHSLKLDGASKGLEDIDRAANHVSLDGIAAGVESLQKRFSTFGIVGMRVIENLTDSVMRFGSKTVRFVTEGIINGGKRRAMNIENAHFQLQGLLKDEAKVQEVMDDAMDSVDGTAYAYDEAAKAASQFAASGMQAGEQMQSSLRAITGVAAMTNSEYESISQIFTTVAGNGRLMGDQLLQLSSRGLNAAATVADYMTKVGDGAKVTEGEVRDMVSKGQIGFELFAAAMDDAFGEHAKKANEMFSGAMSNVKASLSRIGAEFVSPLIVQNGPLVQFFNVMRERMNDVKENIGPLAELFVDSMTSMANAATKFLEKLDVKKPFQAFYNVVDIFKNVLSGLSSVLRPIRWAFVDIFPQSMIDGLVNFTSKLKDFTSNLRLSHVDAVNLRNTFKGLFAVLDIIRTVIGGVARAIFPMTKGLGGLSSGVLTITGQIGEWLASLSEAIKKNVAFQEVIRKAGDTVGSVFQSMGEQIRETAEAIRDFVQNHFGEAAESRLRPFQKICEVTKAAMEKLSGAFQEAAPILSKLGEMITDVIRMLGGGLQKAVHGDGFDSLIDLMNGGLMAGIGVGVIKFIDNMQASVNKAGGMFSGVNRVLFNVKNTLISLQAGLKAEVLMKIAKAIAILVGSLFVLALIDSEKLAGSLAAISILFGELAASMAVFDKTLGGKAQMKLMSAGTMMVELSTAVLILSAALNVIAGIDSDELAGALMGITILIGELAAVALILSKWGGRVKASAAGMVLFASAIYILTKAVKKLTKLDPDALMQGLVGVGVLLAELSAFMLAAKFGTLKATQGLAMIELAGALLLLQKVVSDFGQMNPEVMIKGLLGVAGALLAVAATALIMPKNMIGMGIGLLEVGAALKIIGSVIQDNGEMKWEEVGKGLMALGGSMVILAVALHAMKGTIGAAAAMLVLSAALALFTPCLKVLGAMSLPEIGKAILILAATFTVLGIAGMFLGPMIPAILGLSGALALLGIALAACGVGVLAFSVGLASLAVSGVAGMTALVASLEILFVGILNIIASSAESIANAVKAIVLALVSVVVECAPAIAEGVLTLVEKVLQSLAAHGPNIVTYLIDFLIGIINAVAERLPELIQAVVNLFSALFRGVVDALNGVDTTMLVEGIAGIGLITGLMIALSTVAGLIPSAMVGVIGVGLVMAELALVLAAVGALEQIPGLQWLINEGGELLQGIGTAIGKFVGGIAGGFMSGVSSQFPQIGKDLSEFMTNVQPFIEGAGKIRAGSMEGVKALAQTILILTAADVLDGLTSWFTGGSSLASFGEELASFGPHLAVYAETVKNIKPEAVEGSANAVKIMAEAASSLPNSGGLAGKIFGENNLSDFGRELKTFGPHLAVYAETVKNIKPEAVEGSANAVKIMAEAASSLPDSGGLSALIFGDNTLSQFGEELAAFGPNMAAYADEIADVDPKVVTASANAALALSELANALPETGGFEGWFKGNKSFEAFGKGIVAFGSGMTEYYKSVEGIENPQIITSSANAAKSLGEVANVLSNIGGCYIADFGSDLEAFGQSLFTYYSSVSEIDVGKMSDVIREAEKLSRLATSGVMKGFAEGAKSDQMMITKAFTGALKTALTAIRGKREEFAAEGKAILHAFSAAVKKGTNLVREALSEPLKAALADIRKKHGGFYLAGSYLVDGFVKGIDDNAFKAAAQAKAMAERALTAAREELGVHSPSTVFEEIGGYVVEGFVDGMDNRQGEAAASAERLASVGVEAAQAVVESIRGGDSVFREFVEHTDENGDALEVTLEQAAEAFKSFRNSVKESVESATGLFDAFEAEAGVKGKELLQNLQSQIAGISEWAANMQLLADRGITKGLLKALSDLGPSGAKYVNALVTMSGKKLKKLNALYEQRLSLNDKAADEIAASFLDGGKKAAKAYAKGLSSASESGEGKWKNEGLIEEVRRMTDGAMDAVLQFSNGVTDIVGWTFTDAVKKTAEGLSYGQGAFEQFVNRYLSATRHMTTGSRAIEAASQAITVYGRKLYEESEYYQKDTEHLKMHKKELTSLQEERGKLQKQLKRNQKSNTKASKARVKMLKKELEANQRAIAAAKEQVIADENEIAAHTKEVFSNLRATLSDSVASFLDPLKSSLESGIDLFKKFESNAELYEADQKKMKEHQKSLKELEDTQKTIQDEMNRYADQNTLAARKRVKELKAQLSEVESSMEEVKNAIEQTEKDMESHSEVTVEKILENMQSQVTGVRKWQQDLQTLAGRGISQGLLDKLKEMGVSGVDYVDQFMKMTSEELNKANALFAQSEQLTSQTLLNDFKDSMQTAKNWAAGLQKMAQMGFGREILEKLGEMGVDGYDYVSAFLSMTPEQVAQFNQEFADSLKLPDAIADQVISSYVYAGGQSVAGFTEALAKLSEEGTEENTKLVALSSGIGSVMEQTLKTKSKAAGGSAVNALAKGMKENQSSASKSSTSMGKATLKAMKGVLSAKAGKKVAGNIVGGLKDGLSEGSSNVSKTAERVAKAAYQAAKNVLGIRSPSKKFAELGAYTDEGFMEGLISGEDDICRTATGVMGRVIREVSDAMHSDLDIQPSIRPVMDLTEIQNGVGRIGSMIEGCSVSGSVDLARVTAGGMRRLQTREEDVTLGAIAKLQEALKGFLERPCVEQNNTFSITGDDPKAIANEVSHILQQQVERRNAIWA